MTDATTNKWVRSRIDEIAVEAGCYFDIASAERVREFFSTFLCHSKGQFAGQPFELLPWQWEDVIAPLFGWKRRDGRRRFQRAYVEIPKKNGKSTMAAGLGLYLLVGDGEPGAEVYSAACTRDQASIVHGEAVRMVKASPALEDYLKVFGAAKEIQFPGSQGYYKALPAEAHSAEGLNVHGLIIDELHAWPGLAGRKFYEALKYGGKARRNPLMFIITTAGDDVLGVCYEVHQYAKGVMSGEIEDQRFFAYIRAAEPADDYREPATWRKANPSLGVTMSEDDFGDDVREAEKTPTALAQFLRYALNVWSQGGQKAIRPADWSACKVDFDEADLDGESCFVAIDLARNRDLTAAAILFPRGDNRYRLIVRCWLPRATLDLPTTPPEFRRWAELGFIKTTDGNVTDYDSVRSDLAADFERFDVIQLGFDPWMAEEMTQKLEDETGVDRVAFGQTILNYAAPCAEFERLIAAKFIEHDGNPLLAWQIGNLEWRVDPAGNKRPHKTQSKSKIDAPVAGLMALGLAMNYADAGNVGISSM